MAEEKQVLFAGFGGQGVISMGQFLTHLAMHTGKEVSCALSYGLRCAAVPPTAWLQ